MTCSNLRTTALCTALLAATLPATAAPLTEVESAMTAAPEEVERRLPESHPSLYFAYANRLWSENRRDDAVMWLYIAQLRYRFHLAANPQLEPSGDPALFGSLLATIGPPINQHAGGDIPNWRQQIARALQWDEAHPNSFTSTKAFRPQWIETRAGLEQLSDYLEKNAEALKKQREAAAAETPANRPARDKMPLPDPSREAVAPQPAMPADWPPLAPRSPAATLAGVYQGSTSSPLCRAFFVTEQARVMRADSFEIVADDDQHLRIRALRAGKLLRERIVAIEPTETAVVFTETAPDREAGLELGPVVRRQTLRRNTAGELVIQREIFVGASARAAIATDRPRYTFWNRAIREAGETSPAAAAAAH